MIPSYANRQERDVTHWFCNTFLLCSMNETKVISNSDLSYEFCKSNGERSKTFVCVCVCLFYYSFSCAIKLLADSFIPARLVHTTFVRCFGLKLRVYTLLL